MSTENSNVFKKDKLDLYLYELAKEYKKLTGGHTPAEIILIGGAAIIESYGFRDMTTDIDAVINAASAMKDAINLIGDRYGLPNGWMNSDFQKTDSYSNKLIRYSSFYKTFNRVLNVRVVTGEYLVAMKLRAFRQYKNDLSDIIGILAEHEKRCDGITAKRIDNAVVNLYGSWNGFSKESRDFISKTLLAGNYKKVYDLVRKNEKDAKEELTDFNKQNPGVLNGENADAVLKLLRAKKQKDDYER